MYVDVVKSVAGTSTRWIAESGVLDLFFLLGPSPPEVARQVREGRTPASYLSSCDLMHPALLHN